MLCQVAELTRASTSEQRAVGVASPTATQHDTLPEATDVEAPRAVDLEQLGRDQIAKAIIQRFKGHGMASLVDAILKAQGYTTFVSPPALTKAWTFWRLLVRSVLVGLVSASR